MNNKKAFDIKWSTSVKMANGGFMNKFAEGGQPPCAPGESINPTTGLCTGSSSASQPVVPADPYAKLKQNERYAGLTQEELATITPEDWANEQLFDNQEQRSAFVPPTAIYKDLNRPKSNYFLSGDLNEEKINQLSNDGYYTSKTADGNYEVFSNKDISDLIMQKGITSSELSNKFQLGDSKLLQSHFQPTYDYASGVHAERNASKITKLVDSGLSKDQAIAKLVKQGEGTVEGLNKLYGEYASVSVENKNYNDKVALQQKQRQERIKAARRNPDGSFILTADEQQDEVNRTNNYLNDKKTSYSQKPNSYSNLFNNKVPSMSGKPFMETATDEQVEAYLMSLDANKSHQDILAKETKAINEKNIFLDGAENTIQYGDNTNVSKIGFENKLTNKWVAPTTTNARDKAENTSIEIRDDRADRNKSVVALDNITKLVLSNTELSEEQKQKFLSDPKKMEESINSLLDYNYQQTLFQGKSKDGTLYQPTNFKLQLRDSGDHGFTFGDGRFSAIGSGPNTSGRIEMIYPETWFMGPGAGAYGLAKGGLNMVKGLNVTQNIAKGYLKGVGWNLAPKFAQRLIPKLATNPITGTSVINAGNILAGYGLYKTGTSIYDGSLVKANKDFFNDPLNFDNARAMVDKNLGLVSGLNTVGSLVKNVVPYIDTFKSIKAITKGADVIENSFDVVDDSFDTAEGVTQMSYNPLSYASTFNTIVNPLSKAILGQKYKDENKFKVEKNIAAAQYEKLKQAKANLQWEDHYRTMNAGYSSPNFHNNDETKTILQELGHRPFNKGGPIKWSASVKMNNGGFLNTFVAGGRPPCGPGEEVDPKTGLCIMTMTIPVPDVSRYVSETADNETDIEFPEVDVYAKAPTRKLQGNLLEQFRQVKNAFQNARAANVANGDQYNFGLNLEETSDINELPGLIKRYKDALNQEKITFAREKKLFDQLKELDPETWDFKNSRGSNKRHQSQARSSEGIETLRQAMKDNKLSHEDFMYAYNDWGKDYDLNAVQGKGPGAVYNGKDAKIIWGPNMKRENFKGLSYGLMGALGAVGLGLAAPIIPLIGSGAAAAGTALAPGYATLMGTSIVPAAATNLMTSGAAGIAANLTGANILGMVGMYNAAKGVVDGSTWDANKQVVNDVSNGEFKPKNILNALSKDVSLFTNVTKAIPDEFVTTRNLDRTKALINFGETAFDPNKVDPNKVAKGLIDHSKYKKYGGVVNNILKKYPNFNIHNNALNNYLNGGSVT